MKKALLKIIWNRKTNLIITGKGTHYSNVEDIRGEQWISIRELEEIAGFKVVENELIKD